MTNPNTRLAVDLDDFERQLRQAKGNPDPARGDPLAELARIVGQEDPFRAVLDREDLAPAAAPPAREARPPASARPMAPRPAPAEPAVRYQPAPPPVSATSRYEELAGDDPRSYGDPRSYADPRPAYGDPRAQYGRAYPEPAEAPQVPEPPPRELALEPQEPRGRHKGLMAVAAVLGVAALGIAGALALRGGTDRTGGPPIIQADRNPLKVQPQNPGGAEIPDQNKEIYDRQAPNGQTRVVNREEQPVDVQQAARSAAPGPGTDAPASAPSTATPGSGSGPNTLTASLGEPRRVRTVSIKPDLGSAAPEAQRPNGGSAASTTTPSGAVPTTPAAPSLATEPAPAPAPRSRPDPAPAAASPQPPSAAAPPALAAAPPPAAAAAARPTPRTAAPPAAEAPAPTPEESRTGAPQRTAALPAPAGPADKAAPAGSGFSVQIAVRPSENEARQAFKELQKKFAADLEGRSPLIRQAEVNGRTIFRIRVGPLPREEANALCTKLKSSGGQCFVAKD